MWQEILKRKFHGGYGIDDDQWDEWYYRTSLYIETRNKFQGVKDILDLEERHLKGILKKLYHDGRNDANRRIGGLKHMIDRMTVNNGDVKPYMKYIRPLFNPTAHNAPFTEPTPEPTEEPAAKLPDDIWSRK